MRNTSIALSDHWQKFIGEQIESGRYTSASEVIREALRLVEDRQKRIDCLNTLLAEGEASGYVDDFDFDAYIAAIPDDDEADQRKAA